MMISGAWDAIAKFENHIPVLEQRLKFSHYHQTYRSTPTTTQKLFRIVLM